MFETETPEQIQTCGLQNIFIFVALGIELRALSALPLELLHQPGTGV
jgi:hypothetical protein